MGDDEGEATVSPLCLQGGGSSSCGPHGPWRFSR